MIIGDRGWGVSGGLIRSGSTGLRSLLQSLTNSAARSSIENGLDELRPRRLDTVTQYGIVGIPDMKRTRVSVLSDVTSSVIPAAHAGHHDVGQQQVMARYARAISAPLASRLQNE